MPKPSDEIQELKRRIALLARLEGRPLVCAEGVYLIDAARVRDPRALVAACREGLVPIRVVDAALELASPSVAISARLLAGAQRDLSTIASSPSLRALAREASRIFRRHGVLDQAWIARKRALLVELAEARRHAESASADAGASGDLSPWFQRALEIVRFVHGDDAVEIVLRALAQLIADGPSRRRASRRLFDDLLAILAGQLEPRSEALATAARSLREAEKVPGRRRSRRVLAALSELLDLPEGDVGHVIDDRTASIEAMVRGVGERLLARLESTRSPAFREEAFLFFATHAIAFDPRPRDGAELTITPDLVRCGTAGLPLILDRFGGLALTMPEAITLAGLAPKAASDRTAGLVADGLPLAKVVALAALGHLSDLDDLAPDVAAASAYVDWMSALVPHYRSLGLEVPLTPELFAGLRRTRNADLGVLAVCLMKHHAQVAPGAAEEALARLDATLGLFRTRPDEATSILAELAGTTPGAGRAELPELAAWLDDDAVLDRYVHLAKIAGVPIAPSRALRADFELAERLRREEAHLAALATRTPAQEERLGKLARDQVEIPAVAKTRRRFAERLPELMAKGYQRRLDALFRRIFKEVWGIAVARLTPRLAGAMRFYLASARNRELLGTLLRVAALRPGADVRRALPKNEAWILAASARFDVAAWLAPRSVAITIGERACRLEVERDPLEVLRMGIPFGTCLSLDDGANAASTVVNAADANKQVIYLRDPQGEILARKLVAVTEDFRLIGYHLYVAPREHQAAITDAFASFCGKLAEDTRLPFAPSGKPGTIHEGFWYDDGAVPFEIAGSGLDADGKGGRLDPALEAYCASIGLVPPRRPSRALAHAAQLFTALGHGDLDAVLALIKAGNGPGGIRRDAALWAFDRIDPTRVAAAVTGSPSLALVALDHAAKQGPLVTIELMGRLDWDSWHSIEPVLSVFPKTADLVSALISAALGTRGRREWFNDHGLQHQTMQLFPSLVEHLPIADGLALCDRVEPLLRWIVGEEPQCADCKSRAEAKTIEAIAARYAEERDATTVIRCLQRPRSSLLAKRAALRIAARHALAEDVAPASLPLPRREPLRPCLAARRALAKLAKSAPELADEPDLLAAWLRQSGTATPHGLTLPIPREPPFEALGDLLAQLDLAALLVPWSRPDVTQDRWRPGPWELYFHRRHPTPVRRALLDEAMRSTMSIATSPATDRLAWLGAVDDLELFAAAPSRKDPNGARPKPDADVQPIVRSISDAIAIARDVAGQVAASSTELPPIESPHDHPRTRTTVDPAILETACARVERLVAVGELDDDEATSLREAFEVIASAGLDTAILHRTIEAIVTRRQGHLTDADIELVARVLGEYRSEYGRCIPPSLALALFREPRLQQSLLTALGRIDEGCLEPAVNALEIEARRSDQTDVLEALVDGWLRAAFLASWQLLAELTSPTLRRRAYRIAMEVGSESDDRRLLYTCLFLYGSLTDHEAIALFLAEVARSPASTRDELRSPIGGSWTESNDPVHNASLEAWLIAALDGDPVTSTDSGDEAMAPP